MSLLLLLSRAGATPPEEEQRVDGGDLARARRLQRRAQLNPAAMLGAAMAAEEEEIRDVLMILTMQGVL
jgi:hypothetical protein